MTDVLLDRNEVLQIMTSASANADHRTDNASDAAMIGKRLVMVNNLYGSVQVNATSLNAADAIIKVECCDTGVDADYITKSTATLTLPSGSSVNIFSLDAVITEKFYRVKYLHGSVSAGTLDVYIHGKTIGV